MTTGRTQTNEEFLLKMSFLEEMDGGLVMRTNRNAVSFQEGLSRLSKRMETKGLCFVGAHLRVEDRTVVHLFIDDERVPESSWLGVEEFELRCHDSLPKAPTYPAWQYEVTIKPWGDGAKLGAEIAALSGEVMSLEWTLKMISACQFDEAPHEDVSPTNVYALIEDGEISRLYADGDWVDGQFDIVATRVYR